jgi:hypothetical protein
MWLKNFVFSFPSLKGQNGILHVHCHTDHIGTKVLLLFFVAFSLLMGAFNQRRRKCYSIHYKISSWLEEILIHCFLYLSISKYRRYVLGVVLNKIMLNYLSIFKYWRHILVERNKYICEYWRRKRISDGCRGLLDAGHDHLCKIVWPVNTLLWRGMMRNASNGQRRIYY